MSKEWSNLAKIVYRRTYSRQDLGVLENWNQTVERAIGGNVRGKNVPEGEVNELLRLAKERKAGPAGRGYWFSGAPAHAKVGGAALNNCLSGDTEFVTREGIISFKDAFSLQELGLRKHFAVLDENRSWVNVKIDYHGFQRVREVTLARHGKQRVIRATSGHNWYARKTTKHNRELHTTDKLPIGGYIPSFTAHTVFELSYEGIAHGITFGDGTTNGEHGCSVKLFGHKKELTKFFARPFAETSDEYKSLQVSYLPTHYKKLPNLSESNNYLAGFLAGVIATDGSVHKNGSVAISSSDRGTIKKVIEIASRLGIDTGCIRSEHSISNLTGEENIVYAVSLLSYSLPDRFILRSDQKAHFKQRQKLSSDDWKIVSVGEEKDSEPVYCVNVPTTHTFTLSGNIFTGNCWTITADDWYNFVIAQDLLMLGGGVGLSVEHQFVSKLPRVKKDVVIEHKNTKDADFIVPDSREGWCELTRRVLESFLVTGKSFTYSTICLRGYGEPIAGFGGVASGPLPLVNFIKNLCGILTARAGKALRPLDAADILTATGELVVSGNVRRSAILIQGDGWDKEYLKAKRWDLGTLPTHRSCANYSIVCEDIEDLHPLFWKTYEQGEPFGIINRTAIQKYGRMGELKPDSAIGVNPCGESTLESGEPCNLTEIALCNMESEEEFINAAKLMQRYSKRVTLEHYHHPLSAAVIKRNRRTGNGITGCLASNLFSPDTLDRAYTAIQAEDEAYSKELGIPRSKRTTLIKPSGTMSKVLDCMGYEGIHAAYSRYFIQRVRFAANDPLVPKLRAAGHYIEPVLRFDGTNDPQTLVVDNYVKAPDGCPVADEDWDTWKQLDVLKMAQKHWADQAVSVTVYYKKEDIPKLKEWLANNLSTIKTISFLCHNDHGFKQAPKEAITPEQYEKLSAKIKPLELDDIAEGDMVDGLECAGGICPVR